MKKIKNYILSLNAFRTLCMLMFVSFLLGMFSAYTTVVPDTNYNYIMHNGEKYYKCSTEWRSKCDTLESPGGFTVFKSTTRITYYDAINCNDVKN